MERGDTCTASQYEEDIEKIASYYITDGNLRIFLQCSNDGSGKFGQRSASRYQSQADNRFTDSQTAGNTSGSIDK